MQQKNTLARNLFNRIFAGQATPQETKRAVRWLNLLDVSDRELADQEIEDHRQNFERSFEDRFLRKPRVKVAYLTPFRIAVAAAVVILVTATVVFWMLRTGDIPYHNAIALAGERTEVSLPDGTIVRLNHASRLTYPETFSGNTREVILEGEGFFNVAHNPDKPFIVKAGSMNVRVLGTSFNVANYANDDQLRVTVATGKVGVTLPEYPDAIHLVPGQQLSYDVRTRIADTRAVDVQQQVAWQEDKLIIENESIAVLCKRLERWYGVSIEIQSPAIAQQKISFELTNESLPEVMKLMSIVGKFKYAITGTQVSIWKHTDQQKKGGV